MYKRKEFKCAAFMTIAYSCLSFVYVLTELQGIDISLIKDANQSVCFSQLNRLWYFFAAIYPFLIVLPCATSYIEDYKNQLLPIYLSRCSRTDYYISKLAACFVNTALVMAIPFLINLILCNIFLPHNCNTWLGQYQLENYYRNILGTNLLYHTGHTEMPLFRIFLVSPFLYNLIFLMIFSLFSGVVASGMMSFSFLCKKNKIVLFIPFYVVVRALRVYDNYMFSSAMDQGRLYTNYDILDYITPMSSKGHSVWFIIAVVAAIVVMITLFTLYAIKNDIKSMQ